MIEISHLSKTFRSDTGEQPILENFDLKIGTGEVVTIFGPNGCGKSTLLNILAGLIEPNQGSVVRFADRTDDFAVGYVFQNYADTLLPWLNVRDNVAFPLQIRKLSADEINEKVESRLKQFGLEQLGSRFTYELSGGQKQLVAIARAMVYEPDLLILDEPFGHSYGRCGDRSLSPHCASHTTSTRQYSLGNESAYCRRDLGMSSRTLAYPWAGIVPSHY